MSKSDYPGVTQYGPSRALPRALIHKKILDEAQSSPDASIVEIAAAVSGASADLVERVLDDYGDPAESVDGTDGKEDSPRHDPTQDGRDDDTSPDVPYPSELTEKQRETILAIHEHPDATQVELAEMLDVTNATISKRVSAIEGFEWEERKEFVPKVMRNGLAAWDGADCAPGPDVPPEWSLALLSKVEALEDDLASLEQQLCDGHVPSGVGLTPSPELTSKILHACIRSDRVTADEEVEIVELMLSITECPE